MKMGCNAACSNACFKKNNKKTTTRNPRYELLSSEHAPMRTQSARDQSSENPTIDLTVHQSVSSPRAKRRLTSQTNQKTKFPEVQFVINQKHPASSPRASPRVQRRERPASMDYTRANQQNFQQQRNQHNRPHHQRHQNRQQASRTFHIPSFAEFNIKL